MSCAGERYGANADCSAADRPGSMSTVAYRSSMVLRLTVALDHSL